MMAEMESWLTSGEKSPDEHALKIRLHAPL
jgi:hypothetical protein